jgi:hypothetical protein
MLPLSQELVFGGPSGLPAGNYDEALRRAERAASRAARATKLLKLRLSTFAAFCTALYSSVVKYANTFLLRSPSALRLERIGSVLFT